MIKYPFLKEKNPHIHAKKKKSLTWLVNKGLINSEKA